MVPTSRTYTSALIHDITMTEANATGECFDSPMLGVDVNVTGIVTAKMSDKTGFWIQHNASLWAGIYVNVEHTEVCH